MLDWKKNKMRKERKKFWLLHSQWRTKGSTDETEEEEEGEEE